MTRSHVVVCLLCLHLLLCDFGQTEPASERECNCLIGLGCNFTGLYCSPHDKNCNKENVALGKRSNVSSFEGQNLTLYFDDTPEACLVVNGNTDTKYIHSSSQELWPNCIKTDPMQEEGSWMVDLGARYTVSEITIYAANTLEHLMENAVVSVDDKVCYRFVRFRDRSQRYPLQNNLRCTVPLRGQIVKVYKPKFPWTGQYDPARYILSLCEVQVWVCRPGFYGENCNRTCECPGRCDNYFGFCETTLSDEPQHRYVITLEPVQQKTMTSEVGIIIVFVATATGSLLIVLASKTLNEEEEEENDDLGRGSSLQNDSGQPGDNNKDEVGDSAHSTETRRETLHAPKKSKKVSFRIENEKENTADNLREKTIEV